MVAPAHGTTVTQPLAHAPGQRRVRLVDRLDPRLVNVLTALGFGLPLAGYFSFLGRYSVNVVVGDQFDDLTVIQHTYKNLFDWGALWAQHNENRIFFPNLIVVLLTRTTHFNIQVEEYLSAVMLVTAVGLIIWAHKRRSPETPWLYYCPVVILALSIVQFENTLWGFQMAWYLVLLSLAVALVLLDRPTMTWWVMVAAIVAAVVGSYSSLQGLLIWPAGLVLLYHRRRRPAFAVTWITAGVATAALYFYHFDFSSSSGILRIGLDHPLGAARFFLFALGEIVGFRVDRLDSGNRAVSTLGLVIVLLALAVLILYGIRRDSTDGGPIGVALICVGLLFAAIIGEGRAYYGYSGAGSSPLHHVRPAGSDRHLPGTPAPSEHYRARDARARAMARRSDRGARRCERVRRPFPRGSTGWVPAARWLLAAVIVQDTVRHPLRPGGRQTTYTASSWRTGCSATSAPTPGGASTGCICPSQPIHPPSGVHSREVQPEPIRQREHEPVTKPFRWPGSIQSGLRAKRPKIPILVADI